MFRLARLRATSACNNDCIYCFSRKLRQEEDIEYKKRIDDARDERTTGISIVGGEPTLREDILDIVSYAREAGFKRIGMLTNARLLSDKEFAANLIEAGVSDFTVKLWGPSKEIHDAITRTEGSFEQTVEGIKNIVSIKGAEAIFGKTGILMDNYEHLPELSQRWIDLGVKWMSFDLPPVETDLIPLVPQTADYFRKAVETANRSNTYLGVENVPFCFMKGHEDNVVTYLLRKDGVEDSGFLDFVKVRPNENKAKAPQCEECTHSNLCDGLWKKHFEKEYVSEIDPIKKIKKERAFERIEDLKGNLESFYPLVDGKEIPRGLRADALVHFSGGVDSSVAAALYAKKDEERKIVLITYRHLGHLNTGSSRVNASHLMRNYPNIVAHIYVPLLEDLYVPLCFGRDYKKNVLELQGNCGCVACKLFMYACSVYLHKVFFKGDTIVSGSNLARVPGRGVPTPQMPEVMSLTKDFLEYYHMKSVNPVYYALKKQRIIFLANELGLPTTRLFQPKCILGSSILCSDSGPMIQFVNEKIVPILQNVLEINFRRLEKEKNY